jgi:phosphoribosyl 1,2-cyclic phosphodiesterase
VRVKVLASGSKGNVTFIEHKDTRILIDIGMTTHYVEDKLREMDVNPRSIDAILITHIHSDHISGLSTFTRKYNTPTYISGKMDKEIDTPNKVFITKEMNIKDINVKVIRTSHDVESYGYIIQDELVYITDTGYINDKYFDMLKNKKIYIMESNHDIERLMDGPYPYHLKQRILSDKGHLSNEMCSEYLSKLIGKNTECVILAHLSEINNLEDIALSEFKSRKKNANISKIIVAKPKEPTELIEI